MCLIIRLCNVHNWFMSRVIWLFRKGLICRWVWDGFPNKFNLSALFLFCRILWIKPVVNQTYSYLIFVGIKPLLSISLSFIEFNRNRECTSIELRSPEFFWVHCPAAYTVHSGRNALPCPALFRSAVLYNALQAIPLKCFLIFCSTFKYFCYLYNA